MERKEEYQKERVEEHGKGAEIGVDRDTVGRTGEEKGEKLWNSKRKREKEQRMGWEPSWS